MGGGMESSPLAMEKLMEWELVADAREKKASSSAASTTSDSAPNNALVLEYLANMEVDVLTNAGESTYVLNRDTSLQTAKESLKNDSSARSVTSKAASQSEVESPLSEAEQESGSEGLLQSGLAWAPLTPKNGSELSTGGMSKDGVTEELSEAISGGEALEEADLEEDYEATVVILRKVTELALLQSSLPRGGSGGTALATIELLVRLEEVAGGPWEGTPTVHETFQGSEKEDSPTVTNSLEGFFAKVSEALRLTEVQVHLTQAEEKARERRKKRMQFLGTVGGMSALLFVGAGAAVLAAEASLASAYTAYNIFFNPAAISAASAAVEAASGVAGLCGLGAVVPGATAASLGVIDMLKAHTRPVKVGHVARLRMIDCMLGYLEEGLRKKDEPSQDPEVLKSRVLAKWRELDLAALSDEETVQKLTAEHAGRCARACAVATTNLTSASLQSLVRHARLLDLVDRLELLVWNTCFVGVIGPQNAGKSTLIKAMAESLGRKDVGVSDIGLKQHTKSVGAYQLKDTLWVLDCPGSDSISDELAEAWQKFHSLPSFFVLVLHYGNGITRSVAELYQQVRARFPETRILTLVNQVDRYWDELEEDGVEESLSHVVEVLEAAVGEEVDVRFSVLNDKKYCYPMLDSGVLSGDSACQRIFHTADDMSRAFADD